MLNLKKIAQCALIPTLGLSLGLTLNNIASAEINKNLFYTEAFGACGLYSLNYERMMMPNFSVRLGGSYLGGNLKLNSTDRINGHIVSAPVVANYLLGPSNHKFELGAGVKVTHAVGAIKYNKPQIIIHPNEHAAPHNTTVQDSATYTEVSPLVVFGYRYQPYDTGVSVRAGFTIHPRATIIMPLPHVSLGIQF